MTRTDTCMAYAVALFFAGAMGFVYADHWSRVAQMDEVIPGCHSAKYDCDLRMEHGIPYITMTRRETER